MVNTGPSWPMLPGRIGVPPWTPCVYWALACFPGIVSHHWVLVKTLMASITLMRYCIDIKFRR